MRITGRPFARVREVSGTRWYRASPTPGESELARFMVEGMKGLGMTAVVEADGRLYAEAGVAAPSAAQTVLADFGQRHDAGRARKQRGPGDLV